MPADNKVTFPKFTQRLVSLPTGVARFPKVHEVDEYLGKKSHHCTVVFDGDADLSGATEAALAVAAQTFPGRAAEKVNILIKDGDEAEKDGKPIPELQGKVFIKASCNPDHPPKIVGPDRQPLTGTTQIRGGDLVRMVVSPQPSTTPIKGTITFRLIAVQLVKKRSGAEIDVDAMFDDETDGYGAGPVDDEPSTGVSAGTAADDDDLPF